MRSTSINKSTFNVFANFRADVEAAMLEFIGTVISKLLPYPIIPLLIEIPMLLLRW